MVSLPVKANTIILAREIDGMYDPGKSMACMVLKSDNSKLELASDSRHAPKVIGTHLETLY
jgi:hypothetical protein